MDLWSVLKTILRRWYVSLPLVLITIIGISVIPRVVKPTYRAQGTALLAVPTFDIEALKQARQERLNPFLSFNPSLNISAEVISRIVNDDAIRLKVESLGLDGKFQVFSQQNIPGVTVISVGNSPAIATRTVRYVLDQSISTMEQLQQNADVPKDQFIRIGTISYSKKAEAISARQNRARVGLGIFGFALAGGLALLFDALVTYNKKSKLKKRTENNLGTRSNDSKSPAERVRGVHGVRRRSVSDKPEADGSFPTPGDGDPDPKFRYGKADLDDEFTYPKTLGDQEEDGVWMRSAVDSEEEQLLESTTRP